ncbi:MAG: hypothetical protein SNH73_08190 [Rikenellaceae bacterium]
MRSRLTAEFKQRLRNRLHCLKHNKREVISQILGHSDLTTTNTYLDSFGSSVIDEAAKVL